MDLAKHLRKPLFSHCGSPVERVGQTLGWGGVETGCCWLETGQALCSLPSPAVGGTEHHCSPSVLSSAEGGTHLIPAYDLLPASSTPTLQSRFFFYLCPYALQRPHRPLPPAKLLCHCDISPLCGSRQLKAITATNSFIPHPLPTGQRSGSEVSYLVHSFLSPAAILDGCKENPDKKYTFALPLLPYSSRI